MPTSLNLAPVLGFLDELSRNNNKAWFDQHRPSYEAARLTFMQLIDSLIDELRESDHLGGLSARDCVARIYRDIRFSRDKSPYKTNMGAIIAPGGWRSQPLGYYISLEPHGRSMVAGGLHSPTPEELLRFRQAIDTHPAAFKKVTQARAFVQAFGEVGGERLKTAPKGYDRDHPEIELLKLKQVTAAHTFSDQEVRSGDFAGQALGLCRTMRPFLDSLDAMLRS
jgi:uncharacterized protein (TIGR02453 family)